ncbi:MAG: hypothetical protein NVSMB70_02130 [Chamaesiphon sp.]
MKTTSKKRQKLEERLAGEGKTLSKYQSAILDWVEDGTGHAQVGAVAGSGKTATACFIVECLPCSTYPTAILAFNKHIADELTERLKKPDSGKLPSGLYIGTVHAYGYSILVRSFSGHTFDINEQKYHNLCKSAIEQLIKQRVDYEHLNEAEKARILVPPPNVIDKKEGRKDAADVLKFLKEIVRFSQLTLTPSKDEAALIKMIQHYGIEKPDIAGAMEWAISQVDRILNLGSKEASDFHNIGFEDLIWLPNYWDLEVATKKFLIVDEAQDANAAMQGIYRRMVTGGGRLILLGDERQAIQGFAGSDAHSWQHLKEEFNPTELPLSVCYRCPKSHLELARKIVPQIEYREGAPEGIVEVLHPKDVKDRVAPGDLVICRLTAPLIQLCLKLIIGGIQAKVRGRDLGKSLTALANRAVDDAAYPSSFKSALSGYCDPKIAQLKDNGEEAQAESLEDRKAALFACFDFFGLEVKSLAEFCDRVESLFTDDTAAVILATIHRSKGDEADTVFLLGSNNLPFSHRKSQQEWQIQQEWNLVYVALTRAKKNLYLVPLPPPYKGRNFEESLKDELGGMELPAPEEKPEPSPLEIQFPIKSRIQKTYEDGFVEVGTVFGYKGDLVTFFNDDDYFSFGRLPHISPLPNGAENL